MTTTERDHDHSEPNNRERAELTEEEHRDSGILHDIFLSFFETYSANDLWRIVRQRLIPNVEYIFSQMPEIGRAVTFKWWRDDRERAMKFMTYEELVYQVEDHMPRLLEVAQRPECRHWFTYFIKDVIDYLDKVV